VVCAKDEIYLCYIIVSRGKCDEQTCWGTCSGDYHDGSLCSEIRACVCRGVLRVWGMRIQDSRTDFGGKTAFFIVPTSTRGWCKIRVLSREFYYNMGNYLGSQD
jgi:hypothetical protein